MKETYLLRLVPELNDKVAKLAKKMGVSKNGLIILILNEYVEKQEKQ